MKLRTRITVGVIVAAIITLVGAPALVSAQDDEPTFVVTFTPPGIQLLDGETFEDNGHLNVHTTTGTYNFHFEGKCVTRADAECAGIRHDVAQFIGADWFPLGRFIPNLGCVLWVQKSGHDYHYTAPCGTPSPTVTPTPTPTATPTPTPAPTPTPEPTPTATPTVTPTPTPSVTVEPTPEPTATAGPLPTATPSPESTEGVGPTPQYTEAPTPDVKRLAESGGVVPWLLTIGAIITIAVGGHLITRKKARQ